MSMDAATRTSWLERYRSGPSLLRRAWDETPAEMRSWRPAEGAWSALEVVAHCADSEALQAPSAGRQDLISAGVSSQARRSRLGPER